MMSDATISWGSTFCLSGYFKLVGNQAANCDLMMQAGFAEDDATASILRVMPRISDPHGERSGQIVDVTIDDDGKGSEELALPVGGEEVCFTANFEVREDLGNYVKVNLSGAGIEPYSDEFFVNDLRPVTPATLSLAELAQAPEGGDHDVNAPLGGVSEAVRPGVDGWLPDHCGSAALVADAIARS
jgi:hypothetical protein